MLDLLGSLFIAGYLGSILVAVFRRAEELAALPWIAAFGGMWGGLQFSAISANAAGLPLALPLNVIMFALTLALLSLAWLAPALRRAVAATSIRTLLALNAWRLGGIFFLLLYFEERLPTPFAPVAAIGDMIVGAVAVALLVGHGRGHRIRPAAIGAWNLFGLLDLLTAVSLALLSAPGLPFQMFGDPEQGLAFLSPPWILVPAAIVPILIFLHLGIFVKLGSGRLGLPELRNEGIIK